MVVALLVALTERIQLDGTDAVLLIAAFGSSAVLIFGRPRSEFSRPRRVIGGHAVSATVGVTAYLVFGTWLAVAAGVAVAGTLVLMEVTDTMHPPGGGVALLAVTGGSVHALGYLYVLVPVVACALVLVASAVVLLNPGVPPHQRFPGTVVR